MLTSTATANMDPRQLPFTQTRMRGYSTKLDAAIDPGMRLSSSVALALQTSSTPSDGSKAAAQQQPATATPATGSQLPDSGALQTALDEIATLKSQLAGVETAVTLIRASGSPARSNLHSPLHGRRAQKHQQQTGSPSGAKSPAAASSAVNSLRLSTQQLPVAAGKLVGAKPSSPYAAPPLAAGAAPARAGSPQLGSSACTAPGVLAGSLGGVAAAWLGAASAAAPSSPSATPAAAGAEPQSRHGVPGRSVSPVPVGHSSSGSSSTGGIHGVRAVSPVQQESMSEADMQAVIKDPVSHLLRQSINILGSPAAAAAAAAAAQHGSSTCRSRSPPNAPSPVVPVTRDEAIQLELHLAGALPAGAVIATQQQHTAAWVKQQQQHWRQQLAVQPDALKQYQQLIAQPQQQGQDVDVLSPQVMQHHEAMDNLLKEAAQQVAYHCSEQGRVLDGLRERYAELANALYLGTSSLHQQTQALSGALTAAALAAVTSKGQVHILQLQLAAQQTEGEELQAALSSSQARFEQLEQESQQEIQQLRQQNQALQQQLWQSKDNAEVAAAAAERAAAAAAQESEAKLAAAEEAQQGLLQRLAFLNAQLMALREQQKWRPATSEEAVQTDPLPPPPAAAPPPPEQPASESSSDTSEEEEQEVVRKKRKKAIDLLRYARRGQVRSRLWVVKVIGQLYADKAVADTVADRQGQIRATMPEFIFKWHLNRYGLRHLAIEALSDLLASTCHHAATGCRPALWFARFCGVTKAIRPQPGRRSRSSSGHQGDDQGSSKELQQQPEQEEASGAAAEQEMAAASTAPAAAVAGSGAMVQDAAAGDTSEQQQQQQGLTRPPSSVQPDSGAAAAAAVPLDLELLLSSPAALDFYLFCCCQLAYPNSVVALFPEGEDALPLIRSSLVMESLKAVFRYLQDPDGQALFVAGRLETAAVAAAGTTAVPVTCDSGRPGTSGSRSSLATAAGAAVLSPTSAAAAAAAAGWAGQRAGSASLLPQGSSGRSNSPDQQQQRLQLPLHKSLHLRGGSAADGGASSSRSSFNSSSAGGSSSSGVSGVVGGFGYYSAWALLDLFMAEWVDRVVANGQKMLQLRRTIAAQQPPLQQQIAAAAAAGAARPAMVARLHETAAALTSQLAASVAAAAAFHHTASAGADSDEAEGASSSSCCYGVPLTRYQLVADAFLCDGGSAWQAYKNLVAHVQLIQDRALRPASPCRGALPTSSTAVAADSVAVAPMQPLSAAAAAAELQAASQQGVMLAESLQQQLMALGVDMGSSSSSCTATTSSTAGRGGAGGSSSSGGGVSAAVIKEVLTPGGMATALQLARSRRAAAAAAGVSSASAGSSADNTTAGIQQP